MSNIIKVQKSNFEFPVIKRELLYEILANLKVGINNGLEI